MLNVKWERNFFRKIALWPLKRWELQKWYQFATKLWRANCREKNAKENLDEKMQNIADNSQRWGCLEMWNMFDIYQCHGIPGVLHFTTFPLTRLQPIFALISDQRWTISLTNVAFWHPSDLGLKMKGKLLEFWRNPKRCKSAQERCSRLLWENKQTVKAPLYIYIYAMQCAHT